MRIENDPSLVFDEQAISDADALADAQIRISRSPTGYVFARSKETGAQLAPINQAVATLESALTKGLSVHLEIPQ
jgi:hypothetical protein